MTVALAPRAEVRAHDHAILVYDREDDLVVHLRRYLEDGLRRSEETLFVHAFADPELHRFLARARPDWRSLTEEGRLHLAHHRDAFERAGRIDHDHVGSGVSAACASAQARGRAGLRIFVDASRAYFDAEPPRVREWFAFESWLGPRLGPAAALVCAYRRSHATLAAQDAQRTHGFAYGAGPEPQR